MEEAQREGASLERIAARRNGVDCGSHSPFPYRPFFDPSLTLFETEIQRIEADYVRSLELGVSLHEDSAIRTVEIRRGEDSAAENPLEEDIVTFGSVLAWMHSEGINAAGYKTSEMERKECSEGRCRCLGPLARDV